MLLDPARQATNQEFYSQLFSDDSRMQKNAADSLDIFIRTKMREEGFQRKIMNARQVTPSELTRAYDTDKPCVIIDKEPNMPPAVSLPFGVQSQATYIRGPRFRVLFDRIFTRKFRKDVAELSTWQMDIRQVVSDNAVKDMLYEEDVKFMAVVEALVGSSYNSAGTSADQWRGISGGVSRDSINEALKIIPQQVGHFETAVCLVNNILIKDVQKWGREEIGGNMAEEILTQGWGERSMLGVRWVVSIKRELPNATATAYPSLSDNDMYLFAEPKALGVMLLFEDSTMVIDRKGPMLEFWGYESIGSTIANSTSVAKATFL